MRLGVTGHQERPGIDWDWVRQEVAAEILRCGEHVVGLSSLAVGADQIFAQAVLDAGGALIAVIPKDHYEGHFEGKGLATYGALLAQSQVIALHAPDDQQAFLNAGLYVADHCDRLVAVWDGEDSRGTGGTADVVAQARKTDRPWIHIDPIARTVVRHV